MIRFEVRASSGERVYITALTQEDAISVARMRWFRFRICPKAITASYGLHVGAFWLEAMKRWSSSPVHNTRNAGAR